MMRTKSFVIIMLLAVFELSVQAQNSSVQDKPVDNSPKPGLKGFVEVGWAAGENIYSDVPVAFTATMGYQFNQHLFVGLGSGENVFTTPGVYSIPLFGDVRYIISNNSISPFVDVRTGYSISDINGFYLSPSVGCRFGSSINTAFTVSVGYEMQKVDEATVVSYGYKNTENLGGITVKFGFEF